MESCGTSHYWGRRPQARGLRVRLLPVQYVRPYVRRNKTDRDGHRRAPRSRSLWRDSSGAGEDRRAANAASHPSRPDAVADGACRPDQRDARIVARTRPRHPGGRADGAPSRDRDSRGSATRPFPTSCATRSRSSSTKSTDSRSRSPASIASWRRSPARIPSRRGLQTIPGVGVLTATALVGAVGHIHAFRRGRDSPVGWD